MIQMKKSLISIITIVFFMSFSILAIAKLGTAKILDPSEGSAEKAFKIRNNEEKAGLPQNLDLPKSWSNPDGSTEESVIGDIGYTSSGRHRWAQFYAQEQGNYGLAHTNCSGRGVFHYSDSEGQWYEANVQYVKVVNTMAWFTGPVIAASQEAWLDLWVVVAVLDNGESGDNGDMLWGVFKSDEYIATAYVNGPMAPGVAYKITSGDIKVYSTNHP